jgi:hypothetical protein
MARRTVTIVERPIGQRLEIVLDRRHTRLGQIGAIDEATGAGVSVDWSGTSMRVEIKAWMGATHFQMRRLPKVASEMALHVLAYNMKRVMQILGVGGLMAAMRT